MQAYLLWRNSKYRFFRHKDVKVFHPDLIYVKANTKHDTSDKLWELVPVNYVKSMSKTAPTLAAKKNVKTKKVKKGTVNKAKAKTTLSKLKKGKAYYIRARLIDSKGVGSNWSKTKKITTKKK